MQTSKVCGRWAALVVRAGVLRRSGNDRLIESGVHVQCAKPGDARWDTRIEPRPNAADGLPTSPHRGGPPGPESGGSRA